jgi:hypothetical protein
MEKDLTNPKINLILYKINTINYSFLRVNIYLEQESWCYRSNTKVIMYGWEKFLQHQYPPRFSHSVPYFFFIGIFRIIFSVDPHFLVTSHARYKKNQGNSLNSPGFLICVDKYVLVFRINDY